jgi:coenzyme Q-binding protein COQ10
MIAHRETRLFPYSPAQIFDLVADVERYPEFLPWVIGVRIIERKEAGFTAEVAVGFKMIRERYTSRVTLDRPQRIDVAYTHGPFRHLVNRWHFAAATEGCRVDFYIEFEFRSRILQALIGRLFHEAVRKMVAAFDSRARKLYGTPAAAASSVPAEKPA